MISIQHYRPWLHGRVPNGFWDVRENRVDYMNWLAERCAFRDESDWYQVRRTDFKKNFGGGLLCSRYQDSVLTAVRDYRPDFAWVPWKFHSAPKGFWYEAKNRFAYMQWLEQQIGIRHPEDWYRVTKQTFKQNYGGGLLKSAYDDSVSSALREYLPDHSWTPWMFREVPQKFWQSQGNRFAYMSWLAHKLGYTCAEDWYAVTKSSFQDNHGGGLLKTWYGDSPQQAVREFLPDHDLLPWRFVSVPQGYWDNATNRCAYLKWLGQQQDFSSTTDWYRLTSGDFKRNYGGGLLNFYACGTIGHAFGDVLRDHRINDNEVVWPLIQLIESSLTQQPPHDFVVALTTLPRAGQTV